jgi:hypothetical protein
MSENEQAICIPLYYFVHNLGIYLFLGRFMKQELFQ